MATLPAAFEGLKVGVGSDNESREAARRYQATVSGMSATHKLYPEIWNSKDAEPSGGIVLHFFRCYGVHFVKNNDTDGAIMMAQAIMLFDHHCPTRGFDENDIGPNDAEYLANKDVLDGCWRSTVKFFKTRLTCSCNCLGGEYEAAKAKPKTGLCGHCRKRVPRKKLLYCLRCRRQHYCSRECHVAAWPDHKILCNKYSVYVKY